MMPQAVGVAASRLSAGVGQMTLRGCGCKNGSSARCCDGIPTPLTDKAPAAQPMNYPPGQPAGTSDEGCHGLGDNGNCFFWTEDDLTEFVLWARGTAKVGGIDVYRSDYNTGGLGDGSAWRGTEPYYFEVLEKFLSKTDDDVTAAPTNPNFKILSFYGTVFDDQKDLLTLAVAENSLANQFFAVGTPSLAPLDMISSVVYKRTHPSSVLLPGWQKQVEAWMLHLKPALDSGTRISTTGSFS